MAICLVVQLLQKESLSKEKYNEMKQAAEKSKKDFFYSEIAKKAIGQ